MLHRKQLNVFRLRLLPLFLVALFVLAILPQVYAPSSYIGYQAGSLDGNTCAGGCSSATNNFDALGSIIRTPFTGTLVSVSWTSGVTVPTKVLISTFSGTPTTSNQGCNGGGGCPEANAGQASTLQDVEAIIGGAATSFTTMTLGNPVSVTAGQWVSITFMCSTCGSPTTQILGVCGAGASPACHTFPDQGNIVDTEINYLTTSPSTGSNFNTLIGDVLPGQIIGATFQSPSNSGPTITQCYGNCGTPAITLANTNSTSQVNFNTSITLFYEFQSNLNGFISNATVSNAQRCFSGQKCTVNTETLAIYLVGSCTSGFQPFSPQCVGSRIALGGTSPPGPNVPANSCPGSDGSPNCQRTSVICSSQAGCAVSNGQWIGIAISFTFSGWAINDTNTNVPLFQANGNTPTTISQSSSASGLCGGCKMGLWAWIVGNVPTGPGSVTNPGNCGNGIGDYLTCLTTTFCTGTPNAGCTLAGGLFWSMIYSVVGVVGMMWIDHKFLGSEGNNPHIPATAYAFVPLGVQFMFIALGVLPLWWGILLIMTLTIMFTSILLGIVKGNNRG